MTDQQISARGGQSLITYKVGGREYPLRTVQRCHTCMDPQRFEIERQIVSGRTYRKIHEYIQGFYADDPDRNGPSIRSMQDHFTNGHMPVESSSIREVVERRAQAVGKAIDQGTEELVDGITLMETVVMKAFARIAGGEEAPSVRDGLAAAKLLAELGAYDGGNVDQQAYVDAFMAYHETAEQIMDPAAFARFGEALATNPVLRALASRYDGEEVETVPGEVENSSVRDS